ncbi:hypothetical protein RKD29_007747 [Streptomyces tendae]
MEAGEQGGGWASRGPPLTRSKHAVGHVMPRSRSVTPSRVAPSSSVCPSAPAKLVVRGPIEEERRGARSRQAPKEARQATGADVSNETRVRRRSSWRPSHGSIMARDPCTARPHLHPRVRRRRRPPSGLHVEAGYGYADILIPAPSAMLADGKNTGQDGTPSAAAVRPAPTSPPPPARHDMPGGDRRILDPAAAVLASRPTPTVGVDNEPACGSTGRRRVECGGASLVVATAAKFLLRKPVHAFSRGPRRRGRVRRR